MAAVPQLNQTGSQLNQTTTAPQTCLQLDAFPITLQNSSSWQASGCNLGFFCPNNNETQLPQFCPPLPACQEARLFGQFCPAQGALEPVICDPGFYCPPGGSVKLQCPEGHYCYRGSSEITKCSVGASCPVGSTRDMSFLPPAALAFVDIFLLVMILIYTTREKAGHISLRTIWRAWRVDAKEKQNIEQPRNEDSTRLENLYDLVWNEKGVMTSGAGEPTASEVGSPSKSPSSFSEQKMGTQDKSEDLEQFTRSLSTALGSTEIGLRFDFENLSFTPPRSTKAILSAVSGSINAGSLWGIMGASGAGKSTFVNVLMGKQPHTGGITSVNGIAGEISKYKKIIGYVPQDDIVLPELTVRENILHSARVRLPKTWSDDQIQNHVDLLISCLQLSHIKHSLVGSPLAPVISGGQRKRVSIGIELAAAPMALFLDEPTSGLDSTTAASIMGTLKSLSRLGMTIVTVIHQPREEIFESLDSLVLLGTGKVIYTGTRTGVQPYLEGLGYSFPYYGNPADTMGDIIAGAGQLYKTSGSVTIQSLIESWQQQEKGSPPYTINDTSQISTENSESFDSPIQLRGASWHKQMYFCLRRSFIQQYRTRNSLYFECIVGATAGLLIGLADLQQAGENFRGIFRPPYDLLSSSIDFTSVPQMALLIGLAIGLTASAPGVKVFGEEKLVFWREAAAGHNRSAYYIGKVLATIPRILLANFHFTTLYFLFSTPRMSYLHSTLANLLYFYCIYGLTSCISMVTQRENGPLLAVMASLIVGVLNGTSPSLAKARSWRMIWLWRSSPGTWLAEAYFSTNVTPWSDVYQIESATATVGYTLDQVGTDLFMLFLIGSVFRVVAYVGLRFMYPSRQR